jgi:hypothetical protein
VTWGELHNWSVDIGIYRLCSRCGKPDLNANRRMPCHPLPPGEIEAKIGRMAIMSGRFRGSPTATGRPVVVGPLRGRRKVFLS